MNKTIQPASPLAGDSRSGRIWTLIEGRKLRWIAHRLAVLCSPWVLLPLTTLASLYLLAVLQPWNGFFAPLRAASWLSLSVGLLLGVSTILIHEFGHAAAGMRYRHLPRRMAVTLDRGWNPVVYIGMVFRGKVHPHHEAVILLAGSALQLQAAAVLAAVAVLVPAFSPALLVAAWFAWATAVMQLIPVPASDGYQLMRVLRRAGASMRRELSIFAKGMGTRASTSELASQTPVARDDRPSTLACPRDPGSPSFQRASLEQGIGGILELGDEGGEIHIHCPAYFQQLNRVKPADAPLNVANEDLGTPDGKGEVGLSQPSSLPCTPQVLSEKLVLSQIKGLCHGRAPDAQPRYSPLRYIRYSYMSAREATTNARTNSSRKGAMRTITMFFILMFSGVVQGQVSTSSDSKDSIIGNWIVSTFELDGLQFGTASTTFGKEGGGLIYMCIESADQCAWSLSLPQSCKVGESIPVRFVTNSGESTHAAYCVSVNDDGSSLLSFKNSHAELSKLISAAMTLELSIPYSGVKSGLHSVSLNGLARAARAARRDARMAVDKAGPGIDSTAVDVYGNWTVIMHDLPGMRLAAASTILQDRNVLMYACVVDGNHCAWLLELTDRCQVGDAFQIGISTEKGTSTHKASCMGTTEGAGSLSFDEFKVVDRLLNDASMLSMSIRSAAGVITNNKVGLKGLNEAVRSVRTRARAMHLAPASGKSATTSPPRTLQANEDEVRKKWEELIALNGPTGTIETTDGVFTVVRFGTKRQPHPLLFNRNRFPAEISTVEFVNGLTYRTETSVSSDIRLTLRNGITEIANSGTVVYREPYSWATYGLSPGMPVVIKDPKTGELREIFFPNMNGIKKIKFDPPARWINKPAVGL